STSLTNIQSTSAPSTHTNVHDEENNNDQAEEGEQLQDDEFTNLLCAPTQEVAEFSSHNIGNTNVPTFNLPQVSEYRWTKDHPLEQVHRNPSRPVQTRRQLAKNPEMCMYALTVSTAESKTIKEAMADSAWIEAMQEELHQVYYAEGLNHNLFSVVQFCDANLEVAFRKSTCFVRDLQGNDLLTGNRGPDLYTISIQESTSSTPLCLMAKATPTQAWFWHRRLSHLSFDYINLILKKDIVIGLPKLKYIASINKKKYILVFVDDYSIYAWTLFLRSNDETPEVLKDFLMMTQRNLQALVVTVRIDRGKKFLNKTLNAFFKEEGIEHQTSAARTPEQNGVIERQNRTLVEAA
nr:ribonuclease H-like domain-containing protein [Tanacetum cinerariifolium]